MTNIPPVEFFNEIMNYINRLDREGIHIPSPNILYREGDGQNLRIEFVPVRQNTNYYLYANEEFKTEIRENGELIKFYNSSCINLFPHDSDFVGRFTPQYVNYTKNYIKENYEDIIKSICIEYIHFLDNIFIPIINSLYEKNKNEKNTHVRLILNKYIKSIESESIPTCNNSCTICMDDINGVGCSEYIKLPCDHSFHYKCLYDWAMCSSTITCPVCRKKIE